MNTSSTGSSRPAGRLLVLLVLTVLAGVLGMHALSPAGVPSAQPEPGHTMTAARTASASDAHTTYADRGCSHTDGGTDRLHHADATCAAAGVGAPYAPPALTGTVPGAPSPSAAAARSPAAESGRAPPDLSELQLLRI
ncbi:hypothetical protein GCM10010358_13930 [Streptomyces minutiscleroticus]|uniref:Uncharacterized protein n=1 Tax=Streptomyces minutiscleroticus TaxID=68238 RepID=A0A918KEC6_9ACTN|nr:DUF6153 family protein [Streptomyces minutiscleroticus]GGX60584.1 hypothetical protein GCM10010358_13930 [Streptomyces minutiscleroticus]